VGGLGGFVAGTVTGHVSSRVRPALGEPSCSRGSLRGLSTLSAIRAVLRLANVDLALLVCSFQHGHNGTCRVDEHVPHFYARSFLALVPKAVIAE